MNLDDLYTKRLFNNFYVIRVSLSNPSTNLEDNANEIGTKIGTWFDTYSSSHEGLFVANILWRGQSFSAGLRYKSSNNYYLSAIATNGAVTYAFYRNSSDLKYYMIAQR